MSLNFNADNESFRKILGNGVRYVVPKFQRDYSWDVEQWEELWEDLTQKHSDEIEEHYMGYLVLSETEKRVFEVIDGQQRLTTITIVILAALKILQDFIERGVETEDNKQRFRALHQTYIGFTDPVSLATQPKLTLNRNNDQYFRHYICALEKPPVRNIKASERLLGKALNFFVAELGKLNFTSGLSIAQFIDDMVDRLIFTTITVSNELNAYKVFETLNARGVKLSTPDLLKNYLFSVIDKEKGMDVHQIRELDERWEEISVQLGKNDFSRFVFAEWNSRNSLTPKSAIFKKLRKEINQPATAFAYLKSLREAVEIYSALHDAGDGFWRSHDKKSAESLATLEMFNIVQPHGVLMAAYKHFSAEEFTKILGYIEVISIRYNVIGRKSPNLQERVYNQLACAISNKQVKNLQAVKNGLKEIYPPDEDFLYDFSHKDMPTAQSERKVRFILARLEEQLNGGVSVDDSSLTLEHILPVNPSEEWLQHFDSTQIDECVNMLGNTTLLSLADNKKLKNVAFSEKLSVFKKSPLKVTSQCAEYDQWNRDNIAKRQKWLAELAVKRWKIEFSG